jgi:ABC-type polar amino acid transport system ATPase subunit
MSAAPVARDVLEVKALRLRRGNREVLAGLALTVAPGEVVALMGLSGSGKTTALRAIAGLETFDAGEIRVGQTIRVAGPLVRPAGDGLRREVGMVFQFHHLFEHLSALDNICLAPVHVQGVAREGAAVAARRLLDDLGVGHRAGALPRELSGGEAQRVAIARALALNPPLLLFDEPTASLDPARRGDLGATLGRLAAAGRALLVTSHDDDFVRDHATRVAILAEGTVVESGDPRRVLAEPEHEATRKLLSASRVEPDGLRKRSRSAGLRELGMDGSSRTPPYFEPQ